MARHNAKGRRTNDGKHVRLYGWLLKCEAYRSLKPGPRALLVELYNLYDGSNNGELFLSVREASKRLNISINPTRASFSELNEKGFIKVAVLGSFDHKTSKGTSWILTEFKVGDKSPTKDFMKWKKPEREKTTVSVLDTDGISFRYRDPKKGPEKDPHGIKNRYRKADSDPSTVSDLDTHIVYHRGSPKKATDKTDQKPSKRAVAKNDVSAIFFFNHEMAPMIEQGEPA